MNGETILAARARLRRGREAAAPGERGHMDANANAVAARLERVNAAHALEDGGDYVAAARIYAALAERPDLRAFPASIAGFRASAERALRRAQEVLP